MEIAEPIAIMVEYWKGELEAPAVEKAEITQRDVWYPECVSLCCLVDENIYFLFFFGYPHNRLH